MQNCKTLWEDAGTQICLVELNNSCKRASAYIQFLIDASGSLGANHFNEEKEFVEGRARTFTIGPNNVQIGVAAFSRTVYEYFYMNSYTSQFSLEAAIQRIRYAAQGTNTGGALRWAKDNAFTKATGNRDDVLDVLIIITDGQSTNPLKTFTEADRLHRQNLVVFAIGIGSSLSIPELRRIATDAQHVILVSDFNALHSSILQDAIHATTCRDSVPTTQCVDATYVTCSDSHVCGDNLLKQHCPVTCGLCVPETTTRIPVTKCEDATYVQCTESHVCSDTILKQHCPVTCGLCGLICLTG